MIDSLVMLTNLINMIASSIHFIFEIRFPYVSTFFYVFPLWITS